jgi:transcriptional regulator with XRE-family HTH domain
MRYLVEHELATLGLGVEIARVREKQNLTQSELAARGKKTKA